MIAGLRPGAGERESEQRVRGAEIADGLREFARQIGSVHTCRARDIAPTSRDRLMNRGPGDGFGIDPRVGEGGFDGRRDNVGDCRLAHESLFVRVGFGMLTRGVDVDQIMRKTGVATRRAAPRSEIIAAAPPSPSERWRPLPAAVGRFSPAATKISPRPSSASSRAATAQRREPETSLVRVRESSASASTSSVAWERSRNGAEVEANMTASGRPTSNLAASTASVSASSSQPATARNPAARPPNPENFNAFAAAARSRRSSGA